MSEIYVVTSGYYSDYGISGVFDSKENAQMLVNEYDGKSLDSLEIEVWELNPHIMQLKEGLKPHCLRMSKDGSYQMEEVCGVINQKVHTYINYTDKMYTT